MLHINLAEDGITVVGHDDTSHGVEKHLQHGLGSQCREYDIRYGLRRLDVSELCLTPILTLRVLIQYKDLSSTHYLKKYLILI